VPDPAADDTALFVADGGRFVPTRLSEGPWDPGAQFGGSPAALLATTVEDLPTLVPMQVARFTVDLLRPVPMRPLRAVGEVVREGKRIQVVSASLFAEELEVARSTALRMRLLDLGDLDLHTGEKAVELPSTPRKVNAGTFPERVPPGSRHAVEYLHEATGGYYRDPAWVRLRVQVVAGRPASPMARLAYLADLASGIGDSGRTGLRAINADLSLNVSRYPAGEWIRMTGEGWTSRAGIGQTIATMADTTGLLAHVSLARVVDPLPDDARPW
jgi:hypothetical protein